MKGRWFHSVQIIPSLIGEKPGVKRNYFQKVFENFFMRPGVHSILLYGQNGPDRKNMAIMQDWPVLTRKIAKMQDAITTRRARSRQRQVGADVPAKAIAFSSILWAKSHIHPLQHTFF